MHSSQRVYFFLLILQILAWTSCQKSTKPSILIIAVDKLSNEFINCNTENHSTKSGINILCKESLRFTHSYTTSLNSAAAMGSLLTGLYPSENQLRRNYDRIDPTVLTVQKVAFQNGYSTSFFSGSPHILKKTGLSAFFETFDDSISVNLEKINLKLKEQAELFFQWQINNSEKHFFSIIYNSELSELSKIEDEQTNYEKWDENLYTFLTDLKSKNLWESSYIILIGLNGQNKYQRSDQDGFNNLHSENTNIATLIKAPRKKGDEGIFWKNDNFIDLSDIGHTLINLIDEKNKFQNLEKKSKFERLDLNLILNGEASVFNLKANNRPLIIEATHYYGESEKKNRYSIIYNNYNYLQNFDRETEIYNLINDKVEMQNLNTFNSKEVLSKDDSKILDLLNLFNYNLGEKKTNEELEDVNISLFYANKKYWESLKDNNPILSVFNPLTIQFLQNNLKMKFEPKKNMQFTNWFQLILKSKKDNNKCYQIWQAKIINQNLLKLCDDEFYKQFISYDRSEDLSLNKEKEKLSYKIAKKNYLNYIKILSYNLAYYNAWGLFNASSDLIHPLVVLDSNFFND